MVFAIQFYFEFYNLPSSDFRPDGWIFIRNSNLILIIRCYYIILNSCGIRRKQKSVRRPGRVPNEADWERKDQLAKESKMKLLIAEDDTDLNDIIVRKMQLEGLDVDTCFNGEDAAYRLIYGDYDIAVLDIMMPKMDGLETLKTVRAMGCKTPVIFLTAKDTVVDRVKGLNCGASDYMVKPFSFEELIARIRAVTRTASGLGSSELVIGNLTLDLSSHVVKRNNKEIRLTGKEYGLLEYMMLNKNRILSRERILAHVWGFDYEGNENIVDVYINYLRKKIDGEYPEKLIHTVRGIGYCLREEL